MDPAESLRAAARTGRLESAVPPLRGVRGVDVTEQSPEPVSLERARLLLGWLRAQRAVDICLSELLAAGPAGERRVSREIDRVTGLVAAAAAAFDRLQRVRTREPSRFGRPGRRHGAAQHLAQRTSSRSTAELHRGFHCASSSAARAGCALAARASTITLWSPEPMSVDDDADRDPAAHVGDDLLLLAGMCAGDGRDRVRPAPGLAAVGPRDELLQGLRRVGVRLDAGADAFDARGRRAGARPARSAAPPAAPCGGSSPEDGGR